MHYCSVGCTKLEKYSIYIRVGNLGLGLIKAMLHALLCGLKRGGSDSGGRRRNGFVEVDVYGEDVSGGD